MKTTIELPDKLFREVKIRAVEEGVSLKQYFSDALMLKLNRGDVRPTNEGLLKLFGAGKKLKGELKKITDVIVQEFEVIDLEDWK